MKRELRTMEEDRIHRAQRLIELEHVTFYDFCANVGHIPDNVKHMRSVARAFADWLDSDEGFDFMAEQQP
jgi:hypothetical protein